jgi:hypothetical protein
MDATTSGVAMIDSSNVEAATQAAPLTAVVSAHASNVFRFFDLPRELRDQVSPEYFVSCSYLQLFEHRCPAVHIRSTNNPQIYNSIFSIPDRRGDRALRIERRHLKHFSPTPASILLLMHHESLLLSRQVCHEALEVLLKHHNIYLSCGPFVLKTLLSRIETEYPEGRKWLGWMRKIELEWVTFPNLRIYPPNRENGKDEWWWEASEYSEDDMEVDVDYARGAQHSGHYDEHDYEGGHYDDNFYEPSDMSLYPSFDQAQSQVEALAAPDANDPFGLSNHYPFTDPLDEDRRYDTDAQEELATKLEMLVSMEVTPLFQYFASDLFSLSSITLPLYFISKQTYHLRNASRPGYALPLKIRYWVQVVVHALLLLGGEDPKVDEVKIKYMPWDIWASMDPSDDLVGLVERGVWFQEDEDDDGQGGGGGGGGAQDRDGEGEAFRAVWHELARRDIDLNMGTLNADIKFVKWEGDLDKWRVGDELEVVFTRADDWEEKGRRRHEALI